MGPDTCPRKAMGRGYLQQLWQLGDFVLHVPQTGLGMGQVEAWEWDRLRSGNEASELTCFVCRWQVKIEHSRRYLGLRRGAKVTNKISCKIFLHMLVILVSNLSLSYTSKTIVSSVADNE